MTHIPAVSVIIPARNQEKYVGRCLRSIINQTMSSADYEVIVVDDASEDRTPYALGLFANEVRLIRNEARLGLPGSLNCGIRAARGRFIIRLDADDYVHAEYLNMMSIMLKMNDDFDAVACDYLLVDDSEHVIRRVNCEDEPIGCGIMFRIDTLIDVGLYDETFLAREEEDMRMRFLEKYRIHRLPLPLYRYRRHDSNMTNDAGHMAAYSEMLKRKHGNVVDD